METGPWQCCRVDGNTATAGLGTQEAPHEWVWGGLRLQRTTQTCHITAAQHPVQSVPWPGATQHPGAYHAGHDI